MGLLIGIDGSRSGGGGTTGALRIKGIVQTYNDLLAIEGQANGDVWKVAEQFTIDSKTYLAGSTFAWFDVAQAWFPINGTFDFTGYYPEMSVGAAYTLIPSASDAIVDNTPFIFQSAGGNASIAESATAKLVDFKGNTQLNGGVLSGMNATKFYATGLNQFDKTGQGLICQILDGQKLVTNGSVYDLAADESYFVAIIKSLACYTGQGNNNGYVAKVCNASFADNILVGFATSANVQSFDIVDATQNYNSTSYAYKKSDSTLLPMGYLAICVPKTFTDGGDTLNRSASAGGSDAVQEGADGASRGCHAPFLAGGRSLDNAGHMRNERRLAA